MIPFRRSGFIISPVVFAKKMKSLVRAFHF
jgi:hypothetical protein